MGRFSGRATTSSAKSTGPDKESLIDLPSGKYGQIPDPSAVLLRRAESPPHPVLPKQTVTKPMPKTMRERMPLSSSLTGAGRAGKPGCLSGSTGSKYVGQVLAGRPHGKGDYFAPAVQPGKPMRLVYSGDFVKGAKEGQGTAYYSNGEVYSGDWLHNTRTGYGRLTHVDGCVYEGVWKADKRHGVGTYYSTNGDIFVGTFVDDKRHGLGTTYMPSRGKKYVAEYVSGSAQCGVFYDLAADDVEAPPTQTLRDTINSSTLQQAVAGGSPAQMPTLGLSQPSKVLAREFVDIRKQRGQLKAPADGTLAADNISLLRHAFILIAGGDGVSRCIMPHQLQELMVLAGLDPAAPSVVKLMGLLQDKAAARAAGNLPVDSSIASSISSGASGRSAGRLYLDDLMHVLCFFRETPLHILEQEQMQLAQAHAAAKAAAASRISSASAGQQTQVQQPQTAANSGDDGGHQQQQHDDDEEEQWTHDDAAEAELSEAAEPDAQADWGAATDEQMLEKHIAQHRAASAGGSQHQEPEQQLSTAEPSQGAEALMEPSATGSVAAAELSDVAAAAPTTESAVGVADTDQPLDGDGGDAAQAAAPGGGQLREQQPAVDALSLDDAPASAGSEEGQQTAHDGSTVPDIEQ